MKEAFRGSLEGIKVIDFSTLLPGPLASLFLAETGAEVIKIEKPDVGDEIRLSNPQWGEQSVSFSLLNSCLLYTSPSPRDYAASRMPSSA